MLSLSDWPVLHNATAQLTVKAIIHGPTIYSHLQKFKTSHPAWVEEEYKERKDIFESM